MFVFLLTETNSKIISMGFLGDPCLGSHNVKIKLNMLGGRGSTELAQSGASISAFSERS